MAGIMNTTARQFNLKTINDKGARVTVRVVPGLNDVDDKTWGFFKSGDYVKTLVDQGHLSVTSAQGGTKSKTKVTPKPADK